MGIALGKFRVKPQRQQQGSDTPLFLSAENGKGFLNNTSDIPSGIDGVRIVLKDGAYLSGMPFFPVAQILSIESQTAVVRRFQSQ